MTPDSAIRGALAARTSDPDHIGFVASTLCAVHCLGTALAAGVSGLGSIFANKPLEVALCVCSIALALTALARGLRRHRSWLPDSVGLSAILLLVVARCTQVDSATLETLLSVVGGALLAGAHALNILALRRVGSCCGRCDVA